MKKIPSYHSILIVLLIGMPFHLFSQAQKQFVIGISHDANYLEKNIGLNLGIHYKKNYSQININCNYYLSPYLYLPYNSYWFFDYWELDQASLSHIGLGYTHRYFPNKRYSLFASFLEANLVYFRLSANHEKHFQNEILHDRANIKFLGWFIGYGMAVNFSHRFSFLSSFGMGGSVAFQKYYYAYWGKEIYRTFDGGPQFKFSLLYHLKRF